VWTGCSGMKHWDAAENDWTFIIIHGSKNVEVLEKRSNETGTIWTLITQGSEKVEV
jgi:hypothetical protein